MAKFDDLTPEELGDLWSTAALVSPKLRSAFRAEAMTFAIQDGPAAGQTVPHVHIHMLPRSSNDFERNDEVYDRLDTTPMGREGDKDTKTIIDAQEERKPRSKEEMATESMMLRNLFVDFSQPIPNDEDLTS